MKWQLGLAAWGLRETPLLEQFAMAKQNNVNLLEIGISGTDDDLLQATSSVDTINEVKSMAKKYGILTICASTGNDFTMPDKEDSFMACEKMKKVIDVASILGVKYLRIFAGFSPVDDVVNEREETQLKCLVEVTDYAKNKNVTLVLETHGGVREKGVGVEHFASTSTTYSTLDKILEKCPSLMLNYDPANLDALGVDLKEFALKYKNRIAYMHLKEFGTNPDTSLYPAACGDGNINWNFLKEIFSDYTGPALIEYEIPKDIEDGFKRSLKFIREKL